MPDRPVIVMLANKEFTQTGAIGHVDAEMALAVSVVEVAGKRQGEVGVGNAVAKSGGSSQVSLVGLLYLSRHCRGQGSRIGGGGEERGWGWTGQTTDGISGNVCRAHLVAGGREGRRKATSVYHRAWRPKLLLCGVSKLTRA